MRAIAIACQALLVSAVLGAPASANWLTKIIGAAEHAGSKAVRHGVGALDNATEYLKALPHRADGHALAAGATPEGHWRFVNKAGETFTAASPDELRRALTILAPEAGGTSNKLALYLSADTLFRHRAALKDLPNGAALHMVVGKDAYHLARKSEAAGERVFAEIRPNVLVELADRGLFDEAVFQLSRQLRKADIRVIALQPSGPASFSRAPRIDAASGRALADSIDPDRLRHVMGNLRRQTALITGRLEGQLLYFKPASGPERSLLIKDVIAAAEAADVNLMILKSAAARQPGARNWLWQRTELKGLSEAIERATLADFLDALGQGSGRMAVAATPQGTLRTVLDIRPAKDLPAASGPSRITDAFVEIVSDLAGRVATSGIEASMTSRERQGELDSRIVADVPSQIQFGYLGLLLLGLFGLPVARAWWQRLWPLEQREHYAAAFGYWAARSIRACLLLLFFAPLVAVASAPAQACISLWRMVLTVWSWLVLLWRGLTWPLRWLSGAERA